MTKRINHNHPNWLNHLKDVIDEKWEKKDERLCKQFTIKRVELATPEASRKHMEKLARELIFDYLTTENPTEKELLGHSEKPANFIFKISDFTIHTRYTEENFDLIVDVRMKTF